MHQIFYVDVDEEISSIVEKLRKSLAEDNYFVLNGRSLMAQSVVNLKLLKREAEKNQKNVIVVTQDEQVMKMANRSGIEFRKSLEDIEGMETAESIEREHLQHEESDDVKKNRLGSVGSDNFYGDMRISEKNQSINALECHDDSKSLASEHDTVSSEKKKITVTENSDERTIAEAFSGPRNDGQPRKSALDVGKTIRKTSESREGFRSQASDITRRTTSSNQGKSRMETYDINKSFEDFLDPEKEKRFEKILSRQYEAVKERRPADEKIQNSRSSRGNWVFSVALLIVLLGAGVVGYLYIPSADVKVYLEKQDKTINSELKLDVSAKEVDFLQYIIPARVIENEDSIMLSHDATGVSDSSGKKASGTLVIYNEYGSSPQPLVATTRFETEDGKIFRLVKGVTVPGLTTVGGEKKPGAIEAEVVADQSGSSYNIEASSFKIPGFKGGDKYEKIYAKSSSPMDGGGSSGDATKTVSQADIDTAKNKTEESLKKKMESLAISQLKEGEILLSESGKIDVLESLALAMAGDVKTAFDYQAKAKGKFFIVKEEDIMSVVKKTYEMENKQSFSIVINSIELSYNNIKSDFDNGKAMVDVEARLDAEPVFDNAAFKDDMLAKDENGVREILAKYPYIKNLEISASPEFMAARLPRIGSRIKIEVIKK